MEPKQPSSQASWSRKGLIFAVLLSLLSSAWLILIDRQSYSRSHQASASLIPLVKDTQTLESEILLARISFIYHVSYHAAGRLDSGWAHFEAARASLHRIEHNLPAVPGSRPLFNRLDAVESSWELYEQQLRAMLATVNSGQRSDAPYNAQAAAWASSGEQLVSAGRDLQNGCEALLSSAVEHTNFMLRVSLSVLAANVFTWLALGWIALYERRGRYFGGPSEGGFRSWTLAQLDAGLRSARGHVLHYRIFGGWAMMAVAALAVIMTGLFAVHGMDVLTSEHEWAMHSHQAPADSGALRLHVAEAETATRAYTIPRDRLQVTAEQAGMQASRKTWKKLSEETADNTQQQRKLREVFGFVNMRLASMLRVNDAVRSGGLHAVRALVANSRMSSLKCSLERSIGNFESAAHRSLMEQSLQERHQATASKALLGFVLLPASLGLGFMGALTTQMLRRNTEPQLAHQDWPTALPHRLQSKARFDDVLDRADKNNGTFAVLGMDLDHFKQGNDRWGQETGDQYLRTVVARLGSALRATDTLLRIGGDEFLCLLDALRSQRDATLVAQKLLASLEQPLVFRKGTLRASASIGTASYPVNGSNADELQRKADAVLYEAKVAARGRAGFSAEVRSTGEQVPPALLHAGVLSTAQGAIAPHSL